MWQRLPPLTLNLSFCPKYITGTVEHPMKLPAKALRLVSALVSSLADGDARVRLTKWLQRHSDEDMPNDIRVLVLAVLTNGARHLEHALDSGRLNEDQEADVLNDLGYLQSLGTAIKMDTARPAKGAARQAGHP